MGVTIGAILLGIDFGALAMLVGAVTGNRGAAIGLASTIAAAAALTGACLAAFDHVDVH